MKRTSEHLQDFDRTIKTAGTPADDAGTSTRPSTSQIPQTSGGTPREEVAGTSTRPSTSQSLQTSGVTSREEVFTQPADEVGTSTRLSKNQITQASGVTSREEVAGTSTRPSTSQILQTSGVTSGEEVGTLPADEAGTSTRLSTSQIPQASGVTSREEVGITQSADDASTRPSTSHAVGVSEDASTSEISDRTLLDVARRLGHDWTDLAYHLNCTYANISTYEANHQGDVTRQKVQMLVEWKQRQTTTGCQMDVLCGALARIGRNDIVMCLQGNAPLTDLEYIQQLVLKYNMDTTSSIPAHPLHHSRTLDVEHFSQLELTRALKGKRTSYEKILLPSGKRTLDKDVKVLLKSWDDMLEPEVVGSIKALLSGGAGFGKSTLFLKIAHTSTDPKSKMAKFKLVFLVKLRQVQTTSCVLEAICDQILPRVEKAFLKKVIDDNEEKTAFLFDGLDEIPLDVLNSPAPKEGYGIKDILFNKVLRGSTVLVSTRPHMVDFAVKGYPNYARIETLGFTFETAKTYITSYFAEIDADKGKSLILHLTSSSFPHTLVQIPIIALFLCILWENQSKLPEQLTALFSEFAEALVSHQCNEGEDKVEELTKSIICRLGPVALKGLLNPNGERLRFSSEEFDETDLEDGCRLGFLLTESFTSGLKKIKAVEFLHKYIQEYCAACYFANLHHANEDEFNERLRQINLDNVHAMTNLLRFACGISSVGSPATGLILEHVQKQLSAKEGSDGEEGSDVEEESSDEDVIFLVGRNNLQNLVRLLLLESGSDEMAVKLDRPTFTHCDSHEDLLAMHNYLQCLRQPLTELQTFSVHCSSPDDFMLLRDIDERLRDHTSMFLRVYITCRSREDVMLIRDMLQSDNIRSLRECWSFVVEYIMSDKANEVLQIIEKTLEEMDNRLRERVELALEINEMSHFDDGCVLGSLSLVCCRICDVMLDKRTYEDCITLVKVLDSCERLEFLRVNNTNLHGHLDSLAPLVPRSLKSLSLLSCELDDDDVPELKEILPAGHGLGTLDADYNAFSGVGVMELAAHLKNLPELETFDLFYNGPDRKQVDKVVRQNLPRVRVNGVKSIRTCICLFSYGSQKFQSQLLGFFTRIDK